MKKNLFLGLVFVTPLNLKLLCCSFLQECTNRLATNHNWLINYHTTCEQKYSYFPLFGDLHILTAVYKWGHGVILLPRINMFCLFCLKAKRIFQSDYVGIFCDPHLLFKMTTYFSITVISKTMTDALTNTWQENKT